jgi:ribosomal protein L11 methyltransferase
MRLYVGPGIRHVEADRPGHFDLVFANILAKPLRMLAPALARVATDNGTIILSGLLARDVPGVLSTYAHQGWYLQRRYDLEGWAALVLKRGSARPQPRKVYAYSARTPG